MRFLKFYLLLLSIYSFNSFAVKYVAAPCPGPSAWSGFNASTPFFSSPGGVRLTSQPAAGDILEIPAGCTITVSGVVSISNPITIDVYGQLRFPSSGDKIQAPNGTIVNVKPGGSIYGISNSNQVTIGSGGPDFVANGGTYNGPFVINQNGNNLPIELLNFDGNCVSNGVEFNWSTATETYNDYFLIEKSVNGYDWLPVTKVKGSGTTVTTKKYSFLDKVKNYELTYYRLSQVDYNTATTVFKAIDINCKTNSIDQMVLFPNPTSTELNVLLNVSSTSTNNIIRVVNSFGQVVIEKTVDLVKGLNTFLLPVDINSGSYSIIVASDVVTIPSQKLIIMK